MYKSHRISVVIPAYNEEKSITQVISSLQALNYANIKICDDIIVCDNHSTDQTAQLAQKAGATVVAQHKRGYGIACQTAIAALKQPDIVLFVDADGADHIEQSTDLLQHIINGADLVIASRSLGHAEKGALTLIQRFGNWLSSFLIKILWRQNVSDLGPFRAIRYTALQTLNMQDNNYGWTVEMQIKAIQHGFTIKEIPTNYRRRIGKSKISGTLHGSIAAGSKILFTIFKLKYQEIYQQLQHARERV